MLCGDRGRPDSAPKAWTQNCCSSNCTRSAVIRPRRHFAMSGGLTLAEYAGAKHLDIGALEEAGVTDAQWFGQSAVRIPYRDQAGTECAARFRIALCGDRFRWNKGAKPCLYGLDRLHVARLLGQVVLVEGESDCHAAWLHNVCALGIPGAASWKPDWAELLAGVSKIYIVVEPDQAGQRLAEKLGLSLGDRLHLVRGLEAKDLGELHINDARNFFRRLEQAKASSVASQSSPKVLGLIARQAGAKRTWKDRRGRIHLPRVEIGL